MNVALTRAKNFLFVIANCSSITVNPYWRDLVDHARETDAVIHVPFRGGDRQSSFSFPELSTLSPLTQARQKNNNNTTATALKKHKVDTNSNRGYKL